MGGGGVYIYNSIEAAQSAAAAERAARIEVGDRETTALFLPSNGFEIDTNAPPTDEPAPDRRALASEPNDDDEPDREPAAAPARNPVMVGSDSHDVIVENGRVVYVPRKLA